MEVNDYTIHTIKEGLEHSFSVKINAAMHRAFTEISGDISPLHIDKDFSLSRGYSDRVVYGMLTASMYSRLVGVYLPGRNALLQEIDTSFRSPVYIDDTLTVMGKVVEVNINLKRIDVKAFITNQSDVKVSKARIKVGVYDGDI